MNQHTITPNSWDANYMLSHDDKEIRRLGRQYLMMKYIFDRSNGPLPSGIYSDDIINVLDVAAGSLAWTLDLASMPQVQDRLENDNKNRIHLHACDITTTKFPPPSITEPLGINLFLHDVTTPFPQDLRGKFELVNMKHLMWALTKTGWTKALTNLRELLTPNGKLLLCECDSFFYTKADTMASQSKLPSPILNKGSWLYPLNHVFNTYSTQNNYYYDMSKVLPELVLATPYEILQQTSVMMPMGILCRSEPGAYGQSAAKAEETSAENFESVAEVLTKLALKNGFLEDEDGRIINSEVERDIMYKRIIKRFHKEGVMLSCTELILGLGSG